MIRLSHPNIETKIYFDELHPTLLICENPHEYYNFVTDMVDEFDGGVSQFSFWDELTNIRGDKVGELLLNNFSFELADKKIVNLMYKTLRRNYLDGTFIVEFNRINSELAKFLQELCATLDFATDFGELVIDDLFKCCGVKPAATFGSLLEKIVCYINMLTELKGAFCYVFVGLKDVLDDEDLCQLYNHCRLMKVSLLLIESSKRRPLLSEERAVIITDDLCELTENFGEEAE